MQQIDDGIASHCMIHSNAGYIHQQEINNRMKKNKYLFKLLSILVIMALVTPLTSCLQDDLVQQDEGERGLIIMNLSGDTRAAGDVLFLDDEKIESVRFFVFVNGVLEKNDLFTSGESTFTNPFVLDVATGTKDIYVVANETTTLTSSLQAITNQSALFSLLADEISGTLSMPLVMTGNVLNVSVIEQTDPGTRNEVQVTLTRVAAKVSLNLKKGDTVSEDVKITKVSLLSNTGKTTLFPTPPSTATVAPQSYWDFTKTLTPWVLTSTLSSNIELGDIYLYENITGGATTNATQLEIEALYNNIETTYRVYLNENVNSAPNPGDANSSETTPNNHLYSLKRGHQYKVNGTIVSMGEFDGLIHSTNVLPWEKLASEVLYERIFTISPHPTTANHTFTITNPANLITFTFKLSNPIGATWVAQLSNPIDFEFSTLGGAVSSGGLGTEYTISIKPRNIQVDSERNTEFYITVGGVEIPLLQSSILIGTGNRIEIKQPAE